MRVTYRLVTLSSILIVQKVTINRYRRNTEPIDMLSREVHRLIFSQIALMILDIRRHKPLISFAAFSQCRNHMIPLSWMMMMTTTMGMRAMQDKPSTGCRPILPKRREEDD